MPKLSKFRMNNMLIDITVPDGEITTNKLADNAVTNNKLSNNAVTASKIATGAVSSPKLASGAIRESAIADGAITTNKIADGAVTEVKIANGAITASKITNGTISEDKLDSSVQAKLNSGSSGEPLEPLIIDIMGVDHDKVTNNEVYIAIHSNQEIYFYEQNEELYIKLTDYEYVSQGYNLYFKTFYINTATNTLTVEEYCVSVLNLVSPDGYPTMTYKSATLTTNS